MRRGRCDRGDIERGVRAKRKRDRQIGDEDAGQQADVLQLHCSIQSSFVVSNLFHRLNVVEVIRCKYYTIYCIYILYKYKFFYSALILAGMLLFFVSK